MSVLSKINSVYKFGFMVSLCLSQSANAMTVENVSLSERFPESVKNSSLSQVERTFNLPTTVNVFGFQTTANLDVRAQGKRSTSVTVTDLAITGNRLSFRYAVASQCCELSSTLSGSVSETLCVPGLAPQAFSLELPEPFTIQAKRKLQRPGMARPAALEVRMNPGFIEQFVLPQVREILSVQLGEEPTSLGTGLNMNTPFAQAFTQETRDRFVRGVSCMAHNKGQMLEQTLFELTNLLLEKTWNIAPSATLNFSTLSDAEWIEGMYVKAGGTTYDLVTFE